MVKHADKKKECIRFPGLIALRRQNEKEKGGKGAAGGKAKAQLKAGKQTINQQLVSNLLGDDDDYGEEDPAGYARAKEEEYDFM